MIDFIFVHFHSITFLKAQKEIFEYCNTRDEYRIIVVDGTGNIEERKQLTELKKVGFIDELYFYNALKLDLKKGIDGSAQHAEGINKAMGFVKNEIVCIQDNDFFYFRKGFCKTIEKYFVDKKVLMFGPLHHHILELSLKTKFKIKIKNYLNKINGLPLLNEWRSPVFFGTAIRKSFIESNLLTFDFDPIVFKTRGFDVAYKIHELIDNKYRNCWVSLIPKKMEQFNRNGAIAYSYYLFHEIFGAHFLRGSKAKESFENLDEFEKAELLKQEFIEEIMKYIL